MKLNGLFKSSLLKKIKLIILYCILFTPLYANVVSFDSIIKRVSSRDKETNAILEIDKSLSIRIKIHNDSANIKIWRNMKIIDPNEENYSFKVTPAIQLEIDRILLYKKLLAIRLESEYLESTFRTFNYFHGLFKKGMTLKDVKNNLNKKKYTINSYAKYGSMSITYDGYLFVFENFVLSDIQKIRISQSVYLLKEPKEIDN